MSQRRNAKGAGSLFKDKNGYWTAQLQIGIYPNGRPKYKRFKSLKQSEVIEKMNEYKLSSKNLILLTDGDSNIALEDYVRAYIETYKKHRLKPSSYSRDMRTYNEIKEHIGYYSLSQITSKIIQIQLVNKMVSEEYSYSAIHKCIVLLNESLNNAVDEGRLSKNPCKGVIQPKKTENKRDSLKFLDDEEVQSFLEEAKKDKYKNGTAIALIIFTGLRGGELCALQWKDIDFDKKILSVTKNITTSYDYSDDEHPVRKVHEQKSTKTNSGRIIPLGKTAISLLTELRNRRKKCGKNDYIVESSSSNGFSDISTISNTYSIIARNAGIESKSGIHTLRHTCASLLIRKGIDIKIVSEILGHTNVNFTYNTYVHILDEQKVKAMSVLDNL